jgi:RNA polymerase sigma-70 factor (ECF subfamily)
MDDTRSTLLVRLNDRNDREAWQIFDRLYRPMIVGFVRTRGLEPADAEDIAQQCIQAVLKHIGSFDHRHVGSFKGWLRSIAENKIRDFARRRREQQADTGVWADRQDAQPGPDDEWERQWLMQHLRYCVEKVRPDIAEHNYWAFHATVLENVPAKEAAARLNMTVNQVYVAKFRVLERIRAMFSELTGVDVVTSMRGKP